VKVLASTTKSGAMNSSLRGWKWAMIESADTLASAMLGHSSVELAQRYGEAGVQHLTRFVTN